MAISSVFPTTTKHGLRQALCALVAVPRLPPGGRASRYRFFFSRPALTQRFPWTMDGCWEMARVLSRRQLGLQTEIRQGMTQEGMKRCRVVGGMQYDLPPLRPNGSRFRLLVVVAVLLRLQPCLSVHFQGLEGYISARVRKAWTKVSPHEACRIEIANRVRFAVITVRLKRIGVVRFVEGRFLGSTTFLKGRARAQTPLCENWLNGVKVVCGGGTGLCRGVLYSMVLQHGRRSQRNMPKGAKRPQTIGSLDGSCRW